MKHIFDPKHTLFLIDGSSFLYRAYHGTRPLHTPQGEPVQAVYSFCRMIKKLIDQYHPEHMALVWDSKGKTERHTIYADYKATRQEAPSDIFDQKEHILAFADLIGLAQIQVPGIEADDLMYSIGIDQKKDFTIVLITSDKDMGQMIDDRVFMLDTFKDITYDTTAFEQKMEFPPDRVPLYFALLGDSSDNIPGVKGIGDKGATEIAQQFTSIQDLYDNLDKLPKERTRKLLLEQEASARLSHQLFLLRYSKIDYTIDDLAFDEKNWRHARPLFEQLHFKSLVDNIGPAPAATAPTVPLSKLKNYNFITITTEKMLEQVCMEIAMAQAFAIDTELDGLNPLENQLVGISIAVNKKTAYYIPFDHTVNEPQLTREYVIARLKPIFEDASIKKYLHHAKFDMLALYHYGIITRGLAFDTMVAAQLVTQDWQKIGLKPLSDFFLQETMLTFADAVTNNGYQTFAQLPLALATEYAAADAHQTLQLVPIFEKMLTEQDMENLFYHIELPLTSVLFAMEARGIYCDVAVLKELDVYVTRDLEKIISDINALVGKELQAVNLNSPKQLAHLLFEELKLTPVKKTGKKTGYSTDAEVLKELAREHPVPAYILRYRELYKLKSTYIDALPSYINKETGRIHTTFSQTAVATGRLSSVDPNLQNIPAESADRYHGLSIRAAFKPQDGYVFLSADYSQIELRVLAYFSQEPTLVHAFLHHEDIHRQTAATLFQVAPDAVTHEQRQLGKRINFSILYGLTPFGLSKDLGISFGDAKKYIERYFEQYPAVSSWMERVVAETKEHGYVTTAFGRRRYIPGIYEENKTLYDAARRIAINTKAQGTAAEIMKKGMINLDAALRANNLDAQLLLQIHDELLLQVPHGQEELTEKITREVLQDVVSWDIPLVVTTRYGNNWQDVTK